MKHSSIKKALVTGHRQYSSKLSKACSQRFQIPFTKQPIITPLRLYATLKPRPFVSSTFLKQVGSLRAFSDKIPPNPGDEELYSEEVKQRKTKILLHSYPNEKDLDAHIIQIEKESGSVM